MLASLLLDVAVSFLRGLLRLGHRGTRYALHREPFHFGHLGTNRRAPVRVVPLATTAGLLYLCSTGIAGIAVAAGAAYLWHLARGKASLWRMELGTGIALVTGLLVLATVLPFGAACGVLTASVTAFVVTRRDTVHTVLELRAVRRRLMHGLAHQKLAGPMVVDAVWQVPAGYRARLRVGRGATAESLSLDGIAAHLNLHAARIAPDYNQKGNATLDLIARDHLADLTPVTWPGATSLWAPIPVGIGESGEPVTLKLVERNLLLGGEPGAGKSNVEQLLIATAAADPSAELWLVDGKQVELTPWQARARRPVAVTTRQAIKTLEELTTVMNHRYRDLTTHGLRKVNLDLGWPLHLLAVDELAMYVQDPVKQDASRFQSLLRGLVQRGRAAGIIVIAATQRPAVDTIPAAIRDLFSYRWALRCTTRDASDCCLGSGWASEGADASKIRTEDRGVGWLLSEGGTPRRLKAYYLSDVEIARLANLPPPTVGESNGAVPASTNGKVEQPSSGVA